MQPAHERDRDLVVSDTELLSRADARIRRERHQVHAVINASQMRRIDTATDGPARGRIADRDDCGRWSILQRKRPSRHPIEIVVMNVPDEGQRQPGGRGHDREPRARVVRVDERNALAAQEGV